MSALIEWPPQLGLAGLTGTLVVHILLVDLWYVFNSEVPRRKEVNQILTVYSVKDKAIYIFNIRIF